jgi:hypothetical protein
VHARALVVCSLIPRLAPSHFEPYTLPQLSTWAGLTSTVYFVLAAVHSIPMASLAKPSSGPLSLPTWAEKLQVLMFGLAWSLSVRRFAFVVGKDSVDFLSNFYVDTTVAVTIYRVCSVCFLYLDEKSQSCLVAHVTIPIAIRVVSRR